MCHESALPQAEDSGSVYQHAVKLFAVLTHKYCQPAFRASTSSSTEPSLSVDIRGDCRGTLTCTGRRY